MMFEEGESVEDFTLQLNGMVATIATLGEIMEEYVVVEKILHYILQRLKQIALSISTLLDVRSLTIPNLPGRLRAIEEAFEELPLMLQQDGKLYLTEEWNACHTRRDAENLGSGGSEGPSGGGDSNGGHGGGEHRRRLSRGCSNDGHRPQKMMNVVNVVNWAMGPRNAGPRQNGSKPMWHKKKRTC
jgi:hypothetical protein